MTDKNPLIAKVAVDFGFYVGFTRARHLVYLLCSGWHKFRQNILENGPSRFILELKEPVTPRKYM